MCCVASTDLIFSATNPARSKRSAIADGQSAIGLSEQVELFYLAGLVCLIGPTLEARCLYTKRMG